MHGNMGMHRGIGLEGEHGVVDGEAHSGGRHAGGEIRYM